MRRPSRRQDTAASTPPRAPDLPAPRVPGPGSRRAQVLAALRVPTIRAVATTLACFRVAEMGVWISVTTLAHGYGGVNEATAVVVAQLAPATVAALAVHRVAARVGIRRLQLGGLVVQVVALTTAALLVGTHAAPGAIYTCAVIAAVAVVTTRPTSLAILAGSATSPGQLTAANAVVGFLDGVGLLLGPLVAAIAISVGGPAAPFVVFAALTAVGALVAAGAAPPTAAPLAAPALAGGHGVGAVRRDGVRAVLTVLAAHALMIGALDILFVVIAIDVTGGPAARAAWLGAAFGIGAVLGGVASALLVGRVRLWPAVVGAALAAAACLAAVSLTAAAASAALALAACGIGSALLFVAARTLLQRLCELRTLCRALSIAEACEMAMLLAGAILVPVFVDGIGEAAAPVGIATIVAAVVLAVTPPMIRAELAVHGRIERVELLRSIGLFSTLPAPALETLSQEARDRPVTAGEIVITEGDPGDRFYVIVAGSFTVTSDGRQLNHLGPGAGFGELALLNDAPRAANVVADTEGRLLAIDREPFLVAVGAT